MSEAMIYRRGQSEERHLEREIKVPLDETEATQREGPSSIHEMQATATRRT